MSHQSPKPHAPRLTTPIAPLESGSVPLSEATEIPVRNVCWRCHGQRTLDTVGYVVCLAAHCGQSCATDRLVTHGHGQRWVAPCGHALVGEPIIHYTPCPTCAGTGTLSGWKRLGDLLDWLEEQYTTVSQAITARRGAM